MIDRLRNMTAVYIVDGERVLLLYRMGSRVGKDSWRGIGGHFEEGELNDPRRCALRELEEEVGLTADDLASMKLRYITLSRSKGEVRQNYYFFAALRPGVQPPAECGEGRLQWVPLEALEGCEMPRSAGHMLRHYVQQGIYDERLYCGVATAEGVSFTALYDQG